MQFIPFLQPKYYSSAIKTITFFIYFFQLWDNIKYAIYTCVFRFFELTDKPS